MENKNQKTENKKCRKTNRIDMDLEIEKEIEMERKSMKIQTDISSLPAKTKKTD